MHARVWLLVAMVLPLAGCAQLEDFEVSAPAWEPGYSWTYNVDSSESLGLGGDDDSWQETLRVLRDEDTADGRPIYLVAHEDQDVDTLLAFRKTDLRPSYAMDEVLWDCDGPPACVGEIGPTDDDAYPFPALKFPLEDGKTWSEGLDPGFALDAEVLGSRPVETDAGEMDAVLVRFSGAFTDIDEGEESFDVRVVWDIFYAEEVRMVARSHLRAEGDIKDLQSGETTHIEASMEHTLADYSLEATAPMDAWELWDTFDMDRYSSNRLFIQSLETPGSGDGDGTLRLQAGRNGLDDALLTWTVTDADNATVATGEGAVLDTTVPYGGTYVVDLVASREGREVARAEYALSTHLSGEQDASCDTYYLPGLPADACDAVDIPIRSGASSATVLAIPMGNLVDGTFQVLDSDGQVLYEADGADGYEVEVAGPVPADWSLQFVPSEGTDVSVQYHYQVIYD